MPIPIFNHNFVLPPHMGDPTNPSGISPYVCTIMELCQRFSTSNARIEILKNYINFRECIHNLGVISGFQWLDGSFVQDIEGSNKRSPKDLDVVTFFRGLDDLAQARIIHSFPEFFDSNISMANFKLDHYPFDYTLNPDYTVYYTKYWAQLFSHTRSGTWKGILRVELNTQVEDRDALNFLNTLMP